MTAVRAYLACSINGFAVTAFARSPDGAAEVFVTHHEAWLGKAPQQFSVGRLKRPKRGLQRQYLDAALALNVEGVGYLISGQGYTIVAADKRVEVRAKG